MSILQDYIGQIDMIMLRKKWQPNSRLLLGIRNAKIVENCEVILSITWKHFILFFFLFTQHQNSKCKT